MLCVMRTRFASFLLIILIISISSFSYKAAAETTNTSVLLEQLKQGGLVVFIRHAATVKAQIDARPIELNDCAKQRNLSEQGIQDSKLIGKMLKHHAIAVSEVISSPFCRCKDTASNAFDSFNVDHNLFFSIGLPVLERTVKTEALIAYLSNAPAEGNRVLVSHTTNLKEAANIWPKTEGGLYIFRPLGNSKFEYLGKILPSDWGSLGAL